MGGANRIQAPQLWSDRRRSYVHMSSYIPCANKTILTGVLLLSSAGIVFAQTYKIDPGAPSQQQGQSKQSSSQPRQEENSLGWGSNIQNARLARAAENALRAGNYAAAVDYAERASRSSPNDPHIWFLLGYAARLAGKSQISIDAYNRGLRISPSSLEGMSGLAQTYARLGRREEAQRLLNQVLASDPRRTGDLLMLGELQLQSGEYEQAISNLKRAEQIAPGPRPELMLALAHLRLKNLPEAERYLSIAKHRSPGDPTVLRSTADFYRQSGNYSAAIDTLKSIRKPTPPIVAELAYTYQLSGDKDAAAKLYADAARGLPSDLNLQLSAAEASLNAGSPDNAKHFLNRAAEIDADYYRVHALKGEFARLDERNQDALREYQAALRSVPETPSEGPLYKIQLRLNVVQLFQRAGDKAAADAQLRDALNEVNALNITGRGQDDYLRVRALVKFHSGDTEGALQDVRGALNQNPDDINALQLNGDLLAKMHRNDEALQVYKKILTHDSGNQLALSSLGAVSRELGQDREAQRYLEKLAAAHPNSYVPHLALGDMYASRRDFSKAESEYQKAYSLAPRNSQVVAGGMNAGIEAHQFARTGQWLNRATPDMQQDPKVLREKERYLTWTGKYLESLNVARQAIKKLPNDRDVVVYMGYDLLYLERYEELAQLTTEYEPRMPKDAALPLLAGYIHKHRGQTKDAIAAFSRSIDRDPKVTTAYVNRGFVLHDEHQGAEAATDFAAALKLEPRNGEAHLGMAYASLDLHKPDQALRHAKLARASLGDSMALHLIQGTAYGEQGMLSHAATEYRLALRTAPKNVKLHEALAHTLYGLHQYNEAVAELRVADSLEPNNAFVQADLARSYAQLGDRTNAMRYIESAERLGSDTVYVTTAEALTILGSDKEALQRFERALTVPRADRVGVRLEVARLMLAKGEIDDARRQIVLALMESASGRTLPPTGAQLLEAGNLFLSMHEYQLAETYFLRALRAGGSETAVRVGLANTYLALGDTPRAEAQLSAVNQDGASDSSYQLLLARAHMLRQKRQNVQALSAFALASEAAGEDGTAAREMLQASGDEGLRVTRNLSVLSDFSVAPIFENTTVYALDAQLTGAGSDNLPLPRSSLETRWTTAYHLHAAGLPNAGGFFQIRNARGEISLPSANAIVNRDTWDYSFNFAVNPSFHIGNNVLNLSAGIQHTLRRDSQDPFNMNQNLFRQFLYLSTSSFYNWVSVKGFAIHEAGPFTERNLHSRDLAGALEFRVGRPWSKTAFITGWGARDEQFSPLIREYFYTSTYGGLERQFGNNFKLRAIGEYLRSWRVVGVQYAIAQAMRPAAQFEYSPTRNWSVQGSFAYSRNMGFHAYDSVESGFSVSYAMPFHRSFEEDGRSLPLAYPIRFSAGIQQQTFYNFAGGNNRQFRPYIQISLF